MIPVGEGPHVRPFTPQREPVAHLAARTIGREQLLDAVTASLRSAATSSARPHALLVGAPGAGKTHMVELLVHRARTDAIVRDRIVVSRATGQGLGVTRFEDLLADVLRTLDAGRASSQHLSANPAARIADLLSGRVLLLVIENLGAVFAALGTAGQRALRAWVETSGCVMLLATSDSLFGGVRDRDQPWFGGMATFLLPDLDVGQARALVARVAGSSGDPELAQFVGTATGEARVRAFMDLVGPTPRAWVILATSGRSAFEEVLPALLRLLEALTALHEHVVAARSPNERRLIAAVAASTGSATVSDLAAVADLEQRTAASAFGRLAGSGVVVADKPTGIDRRTTYYRLRDPLLHLHLHYQIVGDEVVALTAVLLRDHYDPAIREQLADAPRDRLRHVDVESDSPTGRLLRALLAAAGGDANARAALPPQWRGLLVSDTAQQSRTTQVAGREAQLG